MINTRILAQEFSYFAPKTLQETSNLLKQYGSEAKIMAGGTDVVVLLKQEKISPKCLINIMKIPELRYIREDQGLRIGAATPLREVRQYCAQGAYRVLYDAISVLAKPRLPRYRHAFELGIVDIHAPVEQDGEFQAAAGIELSRPNTPLIAIGKLKQPDVGNLRNISHTIEKLLLCEFFSVHQDFFTAHRIPP